jgi:hypothetical protein
VPLTREQENELRRRQGEVSSIYKNPYWGTFVEEGEKKIVKLEKLALNIALSPNGAEQRKLDEIRGFIAAVRWILGTPPSAENSLNAFLRRQGIETDGDE